MTALYVIMGIALCIGLLTAAAPYISDKLTIIEKKLLEIAESDKE